MPKELYNYSSRSWGIERASLFFVQTLNEFHHSLQKKRKSSLYMCPPDLKRLLQTKVNEKTTRRYYLLMNSSRWLKLTPKGISYLGGGHRTIQRRTVTTFWLFRLITIKNQHLREMNHRKGISWDPSLRSNKAQTSLKYSRTYFMWIHPPKTRAQTFLV